MVTVDNDCDGDRMFGLTACLFAAPTTAVVMYSPDEESSADTVLSIVW